MLSGRLEKKKTHVQSYITAGALSGRVPAVMQMCFADVNSHKVVTAAAPPLVEFNRKETRNQSITTRQCITSWLELRWRWKLKQSWSQYPGVKYFSTVHFSPGYSLIDVLTASTSVINCNTRLKLLGGYLYGTVNYYLKQLFWQQWKAIVTTLLLPLYTREMSKAWQLIRVHK